jgi:hypothetical protein
MLKRILGAVLAVSTAMAAPIVIAPTKGTVPMQVVWVQGA